MKEKYYRIKGANGKYYEGNMVDNKVVFDSSFDDAMVMDESEIETDFPNGLPKGAIKILDI